MLEFNEGNLPLKNRTIGKHSDYGKYAHWTVDEAGFYDRKDFERQVKNHFKSYI
jgi:hypothetical protein